MPQLSYQIFADCSETCFTLFNGNPLPCFLANKETLKIKAANNSASLFYGFDDDGFNRMNFIDLQAGSYKIKLLQRLKTWVSGVACKEVVQQQKQDGSVVTVELYINGVEISGQPLLQISVVDISDKTNMQQALQKDKEKFLGFIEQSSEGIYCHEFEHPFPINITAEEMMEVLTKDGRISECNDTLARMYGYEKASDIIGVLPNQLIDFNDPANKEYFKTLIDNGFRIVDAESHEKDKEGNSRYFLNNVIGIIEDGLLKQFWGTQRDITERKKTEERLRLLATLVEETSDVLTYADLDFIPVTWNRAAEKIYGLTASQVIGKSIREYIDITYGKLTREDVRANLKEKGEWRGEMYFIRPTDEKAVILLATFKCLKDENNAPVGYVIAATDITERKKANKNLLESETRKAAILESSRDAIVTIDTKDVIIEWNVAAERIFGYSRQEAIGHTMSDLIIPERFRVHHLKGIAHLLKTGEGPVLRKQTEVQALRKDGTEFPSELYISMIEIEGNILFTATLRDITERKLAEKNLKESESRFRDVADSAPVMIWMSNEKNETIYVNKPWTDFTGLTTEMFIGNSWSSIVHPGDAEQAIEQFNTSFTRIEPITMLYRLKNQTGEYRWVLDTGIPRKLSDGTFLGYIGSVIDINDQKIKEDQLRYHATILENVLDVIVTTDLSFVVKSWNKLAGQLYNVPENEAIGKEFSSLVQYEFVNCDRETFYKTFEKEGIWKGEVIHKDKEGEAKYFVYTVTYVRDKNGEKIGILTVGKDITARKKAEERLKESEQFYRSLIGDSLDGILLLNSSGIITFVSPSIRNILGYETDDIAGTNAFTYVHPEDLSWAMQSFDREVTENPEVKFIVVRLLRKDGSWVWCTVRGHNLLDNPYVNSIAIYFHDDTLRKNASDALKASEQRFRSLITDLQVGVLLLDAEGKIIISNNVMCQLLKVSEEALLGNFFWKLYKEAILESGDAYMEKLRPVYKAVHTKKPVRNEVIGLTLPGSEERLWLMINADPVLDAEGRVLNIICSFSDITDRKKLEHRLIEEQMAQQKALTQATIDGQEKERKEIGKELHDNIGQQLTTTKLYLDMAGAAANDSAQPMINMALKSVSDLINEVRSISRSLTPPTLGDLGLIDSVYDLIETINRTQPLSIEFDQTGFDEEKIPENQKLMLFRIVQEQLNNILKHAQASSVIIKLQNDKPLLLLEIKDDGKGFDLRKTRKGLGLTNIKNRAELFGGKLEILSSSGGGCTLKVLVPHNTSSSLS